MHFIPLTEEEIRVLDRLVLPSERARAGWVIDRNAIQAAILLLGIEYPVRIRYMRGRYRYGTHYARKHPDLHHRITMNQDLPVDQANHTLWHELTHAMQSERFERETRKPHWRFYRDEYRHHGATGTRRYFAGMNPYEVEADSIADTYQGRWLLK